MSANMKTLMKNNSARTLQQSGLTLLELVIVISVVGLLAAIASSKFLSIAGMSARHQTDLFANDIRHLQSLAMSWGCELELNVSSTSYDVFSKTDYSAAGKSYCATGLPITNPTFGQSFSVNISNGLTLAPTGSIYFDNMGRPTDIAGSLLSVATTYTLSGGGESWQISIQPITGWVSMNKV